jgi:hypothetical protein
MNGYLDESPREVLPDADSLVLQCLKDAEHASRIAAEEPIQVTANEHVELPSVCPLQQAVEAGPVDHLPAADPVVAFGHGEAPALGLDALARLVLLRVAAIVVALGARKTCVDRGPHGYLRRHREPHTFSVTTPGRG